MPNNTLRYENGLKVIYYLSELTLGYQRPRKSGHVKLSLPMTHCGFSIFRLIPIFADTVSTTYILFKRWHK